MKPIGVVGGIGPESTIDYYRAMIAAYRERVPDGSYPAIIISSIDAHAFAGPLMAREPLLDTTVIHAKAAVARALR